MEMLALVGMAIKGITYGGYGVAGIYFLKTAIRYVQDYRDSVAKEKG